MRISGSDILVDIHPGLQEPVDAASGALVPAGSRDVASARPLQTTPEPGGKSPDVSTDAKSDTSRQRKQDTVEIQKFKQRDTEVLQHEQARLAAAGMHARGVPRYNYHLGPDGRPYAVGGELSLEVVPVANSPQSTLTRMGQIRRAALALANPPAQDYRVASRTPHEIYRTRMEMLNQQREKTQESPQFMTQQKGTMIDAWA